MWGNVKCLLIRRYLYVSELFNYFTRYVGVFDVMSGHYIYPRIRGSKLSRHTHTHVHTRTHTHDT